MGSHATTSWDHPKFITSSKSQPQIVCLCLHFLANLITIKLHWHPPGQKFWSIWNQPMEQHGHQTARKVGQWDLLCNIVGVSKKEIKKSKSIPVQSWVRCHHPWKSHDPWGGSEQEKIHCREGGNHIAWFSSPPLEITEFGAMPCWSQRMPFDAWCHHHCGRCNSPTCKHWWNGGRVIWVGHSWLLRPAVSSVRWFTNHFAPVVKISSS